MDEKGWYESQDIYSMLSAVAGPKSGRKYRLFAIACCRRASENNPGLMNNRERHALEVTEHFVDGEIDPSIMASARKDVEDAFRKDFRSRRDYGRSQRMFVNMVNISPSEAAWRIVDSYASFYPYNEHDRRRQDVEFQFSILRDLFGNPFRPVPPVDPAWTAWQGGTVRKLARAIYEGRCFNRLHLLADALEDAGCTDANILGHCRGGGEHVRGCWVVDLLTERS
jgi:hypothetical protein